MPRRRRRRAPGAAAAAPGPPPAPGVRCRQQRSRRTAVWRLPDTKTPSEDLFDDHATTSASVANAYMSSVDGRPQATTVVPWGRMASCLRHLFRTLQQLHTAANPSVARRAGLSRQRLRAAAQKSGQQPHPRHRSASSVAGRRPPARHCRCFRLPDPAAPAPALRARPVPHAAVRTPGPGPALRRLSERAMQSSSCSNLGEPGDVHVTDCVCITVQNW